MEQDNKEGFDYLPFSQLPEREMQIVVRTRANAASMADAIRNAMHQVDSNQAIYGLETLEQSIDKSLVSRRFIVVLLSIFAGLALLLSALGLYGVVSYGVHMRLRELGIRMALGAGRGDVLRLVLRRGMELAAAGLVLGIVATFVFGRVLSSMLYATHLFQPLTLLATSALLTVPVLLASYLPARRAAKVNPMRTLGGLKHEHLAAGFSLRHPPIAQESQFYLGRNERLALGIGANTAIYSLLDQVLLRSLPVKNPVRYIRIRVRWLRFRARQLVGRRRPSLFFLPDVP